MANDWTINALKAYVDERFTAAKDAIDAALVSMNLRLHDMNQWRQALDEERRNLVTVAKHEELEKRIGEIRDAYVSNERFEAAIDKLDARLDRMEAWQSKIVGAMALVMFLTPLITGVAVWYITHHHAP